MHERYGHRLEHSGCPICWASFRTLRSAKHLGSPTKPLLNSEHETNKTLTAVVSDGRYAAPCKDTASTRKYEK
ncbi:hypothetical protein VIGAN_11215100 [Vigna angularis var. angularis]|uniref:Uncharacterized protein n=1 Tax=Vigna angularis var. angularis TaxID=157739 RepID=A0A0S3TBZ5_PHAAN|nr:hypothetical protein VIGAN_11215100 [Vigna angularis var. angularis]